METVSGRCCETPIEDLRKSCLAHYEELSAAAHSWSNQVPQAINFWYDHLAKQKASAAESGETPRTDAWMPIETAPKDGIYLVFNDRGQVAPWIRGVIHNAPGTAHDWEYGSRAIGWCALPAAPDSGQAGDNEI